MKATQETKHTPGPWTVGFGGQEGDGFFTIKSPYRKRAIAEATSCDEITCSELNANARLIAASPELLAVADLAYRTLGDLMSGFSVRSQSDEVLMRDGHATRNAIAAAIAAAEKRA